MPNIDPDRVLSDLRTLATFGAYKTGVHRPSLSPQDVEARHWFAGRLAEAGLDARIDGIGSVFGFSRAPGAKILTGSHLESQNYAGWLDGPLGVVFGLEAARALADDPAFADVGVDVAAWFDEEGHFGSFLGSRSFVGLLSEEEIDAARNRYDGTPLRDALDRAGFSGRPREEFSAGRHRGYVEAHIEQGDTLESSGRTIGVVTAIVAIWQYRIVAIGEQNHAGTTSMTRRRDAGLAITRLLGEIDRRFPELAGPRAVWTTGRITLEPGAPSIIPGRAEALFQLRDADPAVLDRLQDELRRLVEVANAEGRCPMTLEVMGQSTPALMDEGFQAAIEAAAEARAPGSALRLPSGAGHDAQYLARKMPAAMMFVPSIGGISHHWTENTADRDIVFGAQVFCDAVARMLRAEPS
ncbi:MAG: Acetylornithine deacetylase/Succinyl-diaminopimelate desuccinylase and related deacylases [uncultured Microvirga sp.]|uniref:Acetylornithine deacetylase/Succinyl-diaminopimelate desuccinylase and related deacylases n=1 Tax=uncultured Microvirga sp. TaxID=412392 RepID=A0A6J4MGX5_9HYPH|nr:MAG: Acetylornithine deacetylase/Succinyl-diaminopimelate desuccinylase and related deacylases [uncultured Microvirga sp.]